MVLWLGVPILLIPKDYLIISRCVEEKTSVHDSACDEFRIDSSSSSRIMFIVCEYYPGQSHICLEFHVCRICCLCSGYTLCGIHILISYDAFVLLYGLSVFPVMHVPDAFWNVSSNFSNDLWFICIVWDRCFIECNVSWFGVCVLQILIVPRASFATLLWSRDVCVSICCAIVEYLLDCLLLNAFWFVCGLFWNSTVLDVVLIFCCMIGSMMSCVLKCGFACYEYSYELGLSMWRCVVIGVVCGYVSPRSRYILC